MVDVAVSPCLFNKNPPLSTDTNNTNNPHTFATALDGVTMPIAMHNALAHTFVNTTTTVNHTSGKSQGGVSVEVTGKEVLQFFSFGDTRETMVGDLSSLCLLAGTYLVLAYVLLKWSVRRSGVSD